MSLPQKKINNNQGLASETLRKSTELLISNFIKGKESLFPRHYARVLDNYFIDSFGTSLTGPRMSISKNPFAIIALGGYGREEQCIHSDVDLLFLFEKRVPEEAKGLIREIIYPLWDLGLDVGYATRSIKECIRLSSQEIEILTSLLDARFICGISPLYLKLNEQLRDKICKKQARKLIPLILENNYQRHTYFGDSAYLLEPNLKEGQGGLRDYHTMRWIARIRSDLLQFRDLEFHGYMSFDEVQALGKALQFMIKARNHLHYLTKRKCDQLHFEHQIKIASAMRFKAADGQPPVELFLSVLHKHMEFIKQQHLMFLYELGYERNPRRKRKVKKTTDVKGLYITEEGMLNFISPEEILDSKTLLIKIFEESARLGIPLSAEAKRIVKEFDYLIDGEFVRSSDVIKSFEQILITPALKFNVLNEMLNTGFLLRFIPQFEGIVNRIQYDEYHLYPVDKHSLQTVFTIKNFTNMDSKSYDPLNRDLYRSLKRKRRLLLWGGLLHDIGKGNPKKNHSKTGAHIVRSILTEMGYETEEIEDVVFLVEEHLSLIKIATRRDLNDEETVISCARAISNSSRLKMLYLLTVADSIATGPKAWNEWTAALLRDLFFKVMSILEKGELATKSALKIVEEKRAAVIGSAKTPDEEKDLENLFSIMSPRYVHYIPAKNILEHIDLYRNIGEDDFIWNIVSSTDSNTRTITVCAKDRPGLISKIAGTFTLNSLDILNVQVFTWRNNIALDIFEVKPPPDRLFETEKWVRVKKNLQSALYGELDLTRALNEKMSVYQSSKRPLEKRPSQIIIDNQSSNFFTIVEVFAYDFPGLLYGITDVLFRCSLDVWVAMISTKVDQAANIFYVRDFDGQKVDSPEQEKSIIRAIDEFLPGISTERI